MKRPQIKCRTCEGTGVVELDAHLAAMLGHFRPGRQLTAMDVLIRSKEKVSANAINNRLEDLRALGFLDRVRKGRFFYYFRK